MWHSGQLPAPSSYTLTNVSEKKNVVRVLYSNNIILYVTIQKKKEKKDALSHFAT